jgi:ribonuclease D
MRRLPSALRALLTDATLPKAGCKVGNDAMKLRRDFGVRCAALCELGPLANRTLHHGQRPWNLADLCEAALKRRLPKELRLSDWESAPLDPELLHYAALDAWASRAVCMELLRRLPPEQPSGGAGRCCGIPPDLLSATPIDPMESRRPPAPPPACAQRKTAS